MSKKNNLEYTKQYIRLFQMQLLGVLEDMAEPAELLSGQFSEVLLSLCTIRDHLKDDQFNRVQLSEMVEKQINQMFECISGMQFVDAKRQRIEHVADGLSFLAELDSNINTNDHWENIKNKIQDQYKMDKERNIYKSFLQEIEYTDIDNPNAKLSDECC